MVLFEFSLVSAFLVSLASVGLFVLGAWFRPLMLVLLPLLLPVVLINTVIWGFVLLTGLVSFPLFWVLGIIAIIIYYEYSQSLVTKILKKQLNVR